jgi:hypothetical protein
MGVGSATASPSVSGYTLASGDTSLDLTGSFTAPCDTVPVDVDWVITCPGGGAPITTSVTNVITTPTTTTVSTASFPASATVGPVCVGECHCLHKIAAMTNPVLQTCKEHQAVS